MTNPDVSRFTTRDGKTLYKVSTPTNSKRLIFTTAELAALGNQINTVLGGTTNGICT